MSQIVAIKPKAITFDSKGSYSYNSSESYPLFPTKCEIIMQVNGAWSLSLEVPFDTYLNDYIVEEGIIGVTIRDSLTKSIGLSNEQTFRIEKVQRTQYLITVDAYQTFLDCEQYMITEHMHVVEKNAVYAISQLLAKADEPFAYDVESSDTTLATAYWEWKNIMECLNGDEDNSFLNRWGGEFLLDNHKIIWKRKIDRFQNSPKEELIRISAGVNMTNIQYTIDTSQLVTEIWAQAYNGRHYGKVISAEKDPEDEKKTNYIIDYKSLRSNHFNEYSIAYTSNVTYDKIKLKEDAGESEEENITVCETYDDLNAALEKAVQNDFEENKIDIPAITYDVDFTDLTSLTKYKGYDDLITLCLGDSCQVYNDDLQIETVARVQQITYDVVNEIVTKMTLGDYTIDYFRTQADYNRTIQKVLDIDNGGVKAETINGVIDGQKAQLISSLDVSNQNSTRILKTENTKIGEDFGALAFGSDGVQATTEYLEDGNGWNWEDSILFNQKGIWYGKVGNQEDTKYISVDKAGLQSYDGGVSGRGVTGTITVNSFSTVNGIVVGKSDWKPITYTLNISDSLLTLTDSNGNSSSVNLPEIKTVEFHDGNGIDKAVLNDDYTLTLKFTNGESYTTPPIRGEKGERGIQGEPGIQGDPGEKGDPLTITYQDVAYQECESSVTPPTGDWLENPPDVLPGNYLWTRVKLEYSDGSNLQYYSIARYGVDGAGGLPGHKGTSVTEIKHFYLATGLDSGVDMTQPGWTETMQHIDSVKKYLWTYDATYWSDDSVTYTTPGIIGTFGERGEQGIPGQAGEPGRTSYFHIKYSNSANPTTPEQLTENPAKYIGTYVDYKETDSEDPKRYTWAQFQGIQGEKGERGIPGVNGQNGLTSYLHIKYSDDNGKTFTKDNGAYPGDYIGQYTDFEEADSNKVSDYKWSLIKGRQGEKGDPGKTGIPGEPGKDGRTSYTHIAYSNSSDGHIGFSTSDYHGKSYIGFYVDFTEVDSTNPDDYKWSMTKGENGNDGIGIKNIIGHYNVSNDSVNPPARWSNTPQKASKENKYLWYYETVVFSDDTTHDTSPRIIGTYGDGFEDITPYYNLSYSSEKFEAITGHEWSKKIPTLLENAYIWQMFIITKTDGSTEELEPVVYTAYTDLSKAVKTVTTKVDEQAGQITANVKAISTAQNTANAAQKSANALGDRVSTAETNITQNAESITAQTKKVTELGDKFGDYYTKTQTDAQIKSSSDAIGLKVSDVSETATKAQNTASTAASNASTALSTANTAKSTADSANSKIDNLKIGGRNLLRNTAFNTFKYWKSFNAKLEVVDGWCEITINGIWSGIAQNFKLEKGVDYIISYEAYLVDTEATSSSLECDFGSPDDILAITKTPTKYSKKVPYPIKAGKYINFQLPLTEVGKKWRIRNIKLEKGNKATDWTPAPEDVDNDLATTNNNVSNLIHTTTDLSAQLNVTKQSIQSNVSEISQIQNNIATIKKETSTSIEQTNKSISAVISSTNILQEKVNGSNETIKNINTNFGFDAEGMTIGKSDSHFKTKISNERFSFTENGNEVAYFANKKMYITDGQFTNSMRVGDFAFVPRANGSLDFKKVGGVINLIMPNCSDFINENSNYIKQTTIDDITFKIECVKAINDDTCGLFKDNKVTNGLTYIFEFDCVTKNDNTVLRALFGGGKGSPGVWNEYGRMDNVTVGHHTFEIDLTKFNSDAFTGIIRTYFGLYNPPTGSYAIVSNVKFYQKEVS